MSIAGQAGSGRLTLPFSARPRLGRSSGWLLGGAMLVSALGLLPVAFALGVPAGLGWPTVAALVFRPRVAELLVNTLLLVALAVPLSIIVGVALAWLTERTSLPGRRLWALLATAPLAVPAF